MREKYFEDAPLHEKVESEVDKNGTVIQERNSKVEFAQETIEKEFDISLSEDKKTIERKVEQAVDSPSFLEKIRSNPSIRNALKIMIVAFSLIRAESALGQTKTGVGKEKEGGIEYVQVERKYKINHRLIGEGEYIVPERVMLTFGEVVDPGMIGTPAGGYFRKSFLNNQEKQEAFSEKLEKLGYSEKEIKVFKSYFENNNIVFSENELQKEHFRDVLAHERLHKYIDNLPSETKETLNEARDFILKDFAGKESRWSQETDSLFVLLQKGEISQQEYGQKSKEAMLKTEPILLDSNGQTDGLIPLLINREEFYTYLMMNKFQPFVMEYIQSHFPSSYQIFENLRDEIYHQIQEKEGK